MPLAERFIDHINREQLIPSEHVLLLAVSGGVDSVVLCELCSLAGYSFAIAHCNFRLRGDDSEGDRDFVSTVAVKYKCRFYLREFDTLEYSKTNKKSIQEAARELRYEWFHEIASTTADGQRMVIVTAHHADDNLETVVMNFFRGTGIQGMRGILPKQEKLIRPLLPFRKSELVAFANERNLTWVEDSSNQSDKYSRNFFRQHVLPLVQNIYPEAEQNLLNNIHRFSDIEILYREAIALHVKKLLEVRGMEVHIPVLKLKKLQPLATVMYEIVKKYGFSVNQVQEILKLLDSHSGKYVQSTTYRIIRNRNWLIIAPSNPQQASNILVESPGQKIVFDAGELSLSVEQNTPISNSPNIALLDYDSCTFPLLLRKWKAGDYFYPLGMKKKKKLSRFFIDQKLSKTDKENVWVLESEKKIIWVVGMRIDDRFKVVDQSKRALSVTLKR